MNATKISLLFTLFLLSTKLFAQEGVTIQGKIIELKSAAPVPYAAAFLLDAGDTAKRTGAISGEHGQFSLKDVKQGKYFLKVSALGFKTISKNIEVGATAIDLGVFKLEEDAIAVKEVNIDGRRATGKVKGDTVEFNAAAFKTKPNAAVEELLKKLPGVEIDRDGNIMVQGQKVSRLTVDGKDFFGTDPKMATKNLPADAIAKVQIVDSKTLEAKATGIDDGQREKVLNLTIKEDKKKGWFGNASLSGGTTDKYNGYLSANHFNKDLQFAVLGMSNNINNASFGWEDLQSFSGGNVGNLFAPPAGGNFNINVNNGKATIGGSGLFDNNAFGAVKTNSGGFNYSNNWGKKQVFMLSSSYFTYFSAGVGDRRSNVQDINNSDVLRTAEVLNRNSDNQAHRFNFRAEFRPDSLTDIVFRPNVILNNTLNINSKTFISAFDVAGKANDGNQYLNQKSFTPSLFGEFSVLRRMANKKGSVSLRLNGTSNKFNSDWLNKSLLNDYTSGTAVLTNTNQQTEQDNTSKSYTLNANWVRPVFNSKWNGSLSYTYNKSMIDAAQRTFEYSPVSDRYETIVPAFTNTLDNESYVQSARLGMIYTLTDWNFNFGLRLQQTGLDGKILSSTGAVTGAIGREYVNLLPNLTINFKNKANHTIQVNYNANVNLPSTNDLLPVQNNSNPLYQRIGNPNLEASKSHRVAINFNTFSADNNRYWNGYLLYNVAFDDFSNDTRYANGVQYVQPVNVDGNTFIRMGSFFGMPAKAKGLRMGFGGNLSADLRTNFINGQKNLTNRYNVGPSVNLSYDLDDKLNAGIWIWTGYTLVNNSSALAANNNYFSFNNSANVSYEFIKNLRIDVQLEHVGGAGRADGFNNNAFLLNAGLEKYFMDRRFTLSLKGFDILKQNISIERFVNNSRIEDVRFNNITRYFYLGLNYKLTKVGAKKQRDNPRNTVG